MAIATTERDITERNKSDTALKNKLEDLRRMATVVSDSNDAVIMHDLDGNILAWNRGAIEMYGYSEAEALGKNVRDIVAEADRDAALTLIQNIKQGEVVKSFELRRVTKDGRILDVWLTTTLLTDENAKPVAIATTERDITERNKSEAALKNKLEDLRRMATVVSDSNDAVIMHDLDGNILAWNRGAIEMYGYSEAEALGKNVRDIVAESDRDAALALIENIKQGEIVKSFELRRVTKDGRILDVWLTTTLLTDENAKPVAIATTERDITERKRSEQEITNQLQRLHALREIDIAIMGSTDLYLSLRTVLEYVLPQLHVDAADILLLNPYTQTLRYIAGRGFRSKNIEHSELRIGQGIAGRAALEQEIQHISDLTRAEQELVHADLIAGEDFVEYYAVPLTSKGNVSGVLEIFHRQPLDLDPNWFDFLHTLAGQAAIAIDNNRLFNGLQRANLELLQAYDTTIEGWSHALDLRDKETEGHTLRVTEMTMKLASAAGISEEELVHVRRGALLHDIGKMAVPDHILLKPDKLTDEEWIAMRKHPTFAYELLSPIDYLRPALDIPYCHHEKWDGTGYPRGLKGKQIPLTARLFAVVDVWDALRSDRPYRKAWGVEKVRKHIKSLTGTHFDPMAVELFLKMISTWQTQKHKEVQSL